MIKKSPNSKRRLNSEENNNTNNDTCFDSKESDSSHDNIKQKKISLKSINILKNKINICSNINHNNQQKEIKNLTKEEHNMKI